MSASLSVAQPCDEAPLNTPSGEDAAEYSYNVEFNASLDDTLIRIGRLELAPSWVLFSMDIVAYQEALDDWRATRRHELEELVIYDFPTPIAQPFYRMLYGAENNMQQLLFLRDTWEGIIFVLYALIVGEFRCAGWRFDGTRFNEDTLLSNKMDQRFIVMEKALQIAASQNLSLVSARIVTDTHIKRLKELNGKRNSFSHESAKSEEQALNIYQEYLPDLLSILDELRDLSSVLLLRFNGNVGDLYKPRCESFRGESSNIKFEQLSLSEEQFLANSRFWRDSFLLAQLGEKIWCVSPFLLPERTEAGHSSRIQIYKQRKSEGAIRYWEFETSGVSNSKRKPESDFAAELTDLRALLPGSGAAA